jgi:hypothetical protein
VPESLKFVLLARRFSNFYPLLIGFGGAGCKSILPRCLVDKLRRSLVTGQSQDATLLLGVAVR